MKSTAATSLAAWPFRGKERNLVAALRVGVRNVLDHRKRLATTRALLAADEHMLKDIDVSRFEIALADCGLQTVICGNQPGRAQRCATREA